MKTPPPIRQDPAQPDAFDADRIALVLDERWTPQNAPLSGRDRMAEENIRMLAGRQWDVWSELLGTFVDVTRYMTDEERRWRQRPVVNLLQYWFMLTHARLTEAMPLVRFTPATADRLDELLALTLDPIVKTLWAETGMDDVFTRAMAWLIATGEVYVETAVDFTKGPRRSLVGPAMLSMQREDGSTIERMAESVPFDRMGNPQAQLVPGESPDDYGYEATAEPYEDHQGCLAPRVRCPLEVRSEWGADVAWADKRWVITVSHLTPEEVQAQYGIECVPDVSGDAQAGYLQRLLFSSGHFGAVSNRLGSALAMSAQAQYVAVYTMWEKPSAASPQTEQSPGGRLLVVTRAKVLHDSVRPFATKAAGPIQRAQFIQMPGRAGFGSTPLEQMVPIQKTYNRGWAQILEHRNLCTNPILVTDADSGIAEQVTNLPGSRIAVSTNGTLDVRALASYLVPPPLSADVWRIQDMLLQLILRLGSIQGAEGSAPTDTSSGELVSQLRFNSDRPVSIAAKSAAMMVAAMADDWIAILPSIWTDEQTITYAGEDEVARTIAVMPELWDGSVNVRPDLENAAVEAPEAKQKRALALFTAQVYGIPGTPEATKGLAASGQFPELAKLGAGGSPDAASCRQMLGQLAQGVPCEQLAATLFPWYDYATWLEVTRDHMASPEFLSYKPEVQQQFGQFLLHYLPVASEQAAMAKAAITGPTQAVEIQTQGAMAHVAQASAPTPPDSQSGPPSAGPASASQAA